MANVRLITAPNLTQLMADVNAARLAGNIPSGGIIFNGQYKQMVMTGTTAAVYTVISEATDVAFNASMAAAITAGARPLGDPQLINGYIMQAVGDGEGTAGPIVSTDITDSTAIGRQILTAPDAEAVRDAIGATPTGEAVFMAADAAAARAAIGAGTSSLVLGTTAGTAKEGNYQPSSVNITDSGTTGRALIQAATASAARTTLGAGTTGDALFTSANADTALSALGFTAFTKTLVPAIGAVTFRSLIGAGTSDLVIGSTSTTAKRGDYQPSITDISGTGAVGQQVMAATTQAEAQAAIGAGGGGGADPLFYATHEYVAGISFPQINTHASLSRIMVNTDTSNNSGLYFNSGMPASGTGLGTQLANMLVSPSGMTFTAGTLVWLNANLTPVTGAVTIGAFNAAVPEVRVVSVAGGSFRSQASNSMNLGLMTFPWSNIYSQTAVQVVSDGRQKQQRAAVPDAVLDAWAKVEYVQFKYNDAVAAKGDAKARLHVGMIAQEIRDAFIAAGLDPFAYGLLSYEEWAARPAEFTEQPDPDDIEKTVLVETAPAVPAGNAYNIRPDECQFMELALMRRELKRLQAK